MLPKVAKSISKITEVGGGWLTGLSNDLADDKEIELSVAFPLLKESTMINGKVDNFNYYAFPNDCPKTTVYNPKIEKYLEQILIEVKPDIIHIFGTEYPHTLAMINVCDKFDLIDKVIINIQGLCSVCAVHYLSGVPNNIQKKYTFRDFVKQDNLIQQRNKFIKRGQFEIIALQKARHIIGRTDWDKACTQQISPNAKYHFCNETLRDEFYKHNWDIQTCEKYSIFISQSSYPLKGFHFMLEAMPEILKNHPDAHIYTTGKNPLKIESVIDKLRMSSYSKYIGQIIKREHLEDKVTFMGILNEEEMCNAFMKAHVFVSPSSIENSPNSVGEAMILGVPTITSDVGGVKNMLTHDVEGLVYQHDAPYMLAHYVCEVFANDSLTLKFSKNARKHASIMHNRKTNLETMLGIYKEIIE